MPGRGRLPPALRLFLAFLAGAAGPLSFAPFAWAYLAPVSLAVLLALWHRCTPREAFRVGFVYGLGFFAVGVSWVYISVHEYGNAGAALAVGLTLALIAYMALYPALIGAVLRWLAPGGGVAATLMLFPALWVAFEWVRSWLLTGFPWLSVGYSTVDLPLVGYAPLVGVFGLGFLVTATAGGLWTVVRRPAIGASLMLVVAGAWAGGVALKAVQWSSPVGEPLTVALVQGNIAQEQKWSADQRARTLVKYREMTWQVLGTDLIVWPEAALPVPYEQIQAYLAVVEAELADAGSHLVLGLLRYDPVPAQYLNSLVALSDSRHFYDKRHLVPFGEFFPVPDFVRRQMQVLNMPYTDLASGDKYQAPLPAAGALFGPSICYEAVFGHEVMRALPAAEILINVSNDAWFGDSLAPHQHLQIARMRAIEAARPLLRATNTGITAIIDAQGQVVSRVPQFSDAILTGEVLRYRGQTPYSRWTDWPAVGLSILILLVAAALRVRAGPSRPGRSV